MKPVMEIDRIGTKRWKLNGLLHREDGPAIEYFEGSKAWYINGKHHREDGPACDYADGTKYWYINGKRIDLKQIIKEYPNGYGPWSASDLTKLKLKHL